MHCAETGCYDQAVALMKRGAGLNIRDNEGNTALILAAAAGYQGIVKELIDRKAARNIKNRAGKTAAMAARESGYDYIADSIEEPR